MPIAVTRNQIAHLYTALTNHPTLTPGTAAPVPNSGVTRPRPRTIKITIYGLSTNLVAGDLG
jgi:hypothetical protein